MLTGHFDANLNCLRFYLRLPAPVIRLIGSRGFVFCYT